jgi:hypothetical protein
MNHRPARSAAAPLYRIADRVIASELALPELRPATGTEPHWRLRVSRGAVPSPRRPFHHWVTAAGERWASFSRDGGLLVLRFSRTAVFVVDDEARTVTCHPLGRTGADAIRSVVLNQVLPLLFGSERLVLHASAVMGPTGALVFAGAPGMGKSTLATALSLRGLPLLSDDGLIVDQRNPRPRALPAGVEPRLWPDSIDALLPNHLGRFPRVAPRTVKRRISAAGCPAVSVADRATAVASVFILSSSLREGVLQRMNPGDAVAALTACTFVGYVDQPAVVRETFARVTALVRGVPVFRLGVSRDFRHLGELCETVCAAVPLARRG